MPSHTLRLTAIHRHSFRFTDFTEYFQPVHATVSSISKGLRVNSRMTCGLQDYFRHFYTLKMSFQRAFAYVAVAPRATIILLQPYFSVSTFPYQSPIPSLKFPYHSYGFLIFIPILLQNSRKACQSLFPNPF